jgi:hypothetical protein
MTGTAVQLVPEVHVNLGVLQADNPDGLVRSATAVAKALADVIEKQKLYSQIQGKRFVRCEGWTTLAAMLGVTPHEVSVTEQDGIFIATVELRRLSDGQAVGRASAECGAPDELDRYGKPLWAGRARYARRSMALTRATAKACRLTFSWVMALAGFEVTPAEEIPQDGPERPPEAVQPPPPAPQAVGPLWKGKPMAEMPTDDLVNLRRWFVKQDPTKWAALIEDVDTVLAGRQGE